MTYGSQQETPEQVTSTQLVTGKTKTLGLDYNVAALLAYLPICAANIIFSIIWLNTEPQENRVLRFLSMQSLVLAGAAIAVWLVSVPVSWIPVVGLLMIPVHFALWAGFIGVNIYGMIAAYQGKAFRLPIVADFADKLLAKQ